jgi:glycosyltransferase A (GT-A) superfamily protein (DUF2064 family)
MSAEAVVIVFARAPLPGRAKTRLVQRLGAAGAARLQARLTERALRTAIASRCGKVELHGTPRIGHPFFLRERRELAITLVRQSGRDLGERMHRALNAALRKYRYAILIGAQTWKAVQYVRLAPASGSLTPFVTLARPLSTARAASSRGE